MSTKLVVGAPVAHGLQTNLLPFNIDNDAFPTLENAYQWRGRAKRRRGTEQLGRLTRYFNSLLKAYNPGTTTQTLSGAGTGNLLTGFTSSGIQSGAQIVPGTVIINDETTSVVYTDPNEDGTLTGTPAGSGAINYATGAFTISPAAADTVDANFEYFPCLPVMGLSELYLSNSDFPGTLAFDTTYAYNMTAAIPSNIYNISFYKNPASGTINGISYVQKTNWTPFKWNGTDYQLFWTTNYQGALFATNGVTVPFSPTHFGMQFKPCATITYVSATNLTITITETTASLVIGDWVFINEVTGTNSNTVNFQTGFVTASANNGATTTLTVRFPYANISNQAYSNGILQYLTSNSNPSLDCLRWMDGFPISSTNPPTFNTNVGWVNFCPPLSQAAYSISEEQSQQYYLIGARMIIPFKDRLLFLGPIIQTSTANSQLYLQDTVIYSENGTAFYTASYDNTSSPFWGPQIIYNPLLTPSFVPGSPTSGETALPQAYWEDVIGYGGYIQAGYDEPITSVTNNEDVLLIGFPDRQTRFVYTGNDISPFNFYIINTELGTGNPFSAVVFDRGAISVGSNGIILTSQTGAQRIDLDIPDSVFEFDLLNNGTERIISARDFINEWVYFTYDSNSTYSYFPDQTLFYNYRDNSWAVFNESYTCYGTFRNLDGQTWDSLTEFIWDAWNDPWDSGIETSAQPDIVAGNQQGFVMILAQETGEGPSGYISNISGSTITSPNHNLQDGDYIIINGAIGTESQYVNGKIFSITNPMTNSFTLNPVIPSGTYLGNSNFTRIYPPLMITKQFPTSWSLGRKTRIGAQQYLFTTTDNAQITLQIYLSQTLGGPYNDGSILPDPTSVNDALIYSNILYTCPESTNLGLTPANTNLQMPTAFQQAQIWHRVNTSLLGDTVQLGFTLSDSQLRSFISQGTSFAITGASNANPCVLTCTGAFAAGTMIQITGVQGMTQLNTVPNVPNSGIFQVITSDSTTVTINVDSTSFGMYSSGGIASNVAPIYQFAEIELHGFVIDLFPSQLLV